MSVALDLLESGRRVQNFWIVLSLLLFSTELESVSRRFDDHKSVRTNTHARTMRTRYLFLCGEQATAEYSHERFLEARTGSLKLFSVPERRTFGIQALSMSGMILGFLLGLSPLSALLYYLSPPWRYFGLIVLPVFVLWLAKAWQWSVQIAFHYSKGRSNVGTDVQLGEVRFGFGRQILHAAIEGRQTVLFIGCRRRTLSDALRLASQR